MPVLTTTVPEAAGTGRGRLTNARSAAVIRGQWPLGAYQLSAQIRSIWFATIFLWVLRRRLDLADGAK
jgi:hypothetical protein